MTLYDFTTRHAKAVWCQPSLTWAQTQFRHDIAKRLYNAAVAESGRSGPMWDDADVQTKAYFIIEVDQLVKDLALEYFQRG